MTDVLPFYNYLGEVKHLPGYPLSFGDWSPSTNESVSTEQHSLMNDVSCVLHKSLTGSHVRAMELNLTLELLFDDKSKAIARKILPKNKTDEEHGIQKLRSEVHLLEWLKGHSDIPVPRVLSPIDNERRNFMIMEKLPGAMLLNIYGTLDPLAKERLVESYAHVALELFRLDVPQSIGTFVPGIASEASEVIPSIGIQEFRPTRVFDDIRQYLDYLFEMKKNSPVIDGEDGGHVDELRPHVEGVLDELLSRTSASALFRCVLVHSDLNEMNILVDKDGTITGIIDWEYQTLQPAVLAADYPQWLSYSGCSDPRFADSKQRFWLESPQESQRLRDLYLKIVQSGSHDYWNALIQGEKLRTCVQWLLDYQTDSKCKRMKKWMDATFMRSPPE